jgi:hypothetical protein
MPEQAGNFRNGNTASSILTGRSSEDVVIWVAGKAYRRVDYESEADLETAILEVQRRLFGSNRFYLDVKNKIGTKGSIQNIPDGYLLDLSGSKPRLYVVENELQAHDPLRHIAVQILQFSLSFEGERLGVNVDGRISFHRASEVRFSAGAVPNREAKVAVIDRSTGKIRTSGS